MSIGANCDEQNRSQAYFESLFEFVLFHRSRYGGVGGSWRGVEVVEVR